MNTDIVGIVCLTGYKIASLATGLASLTMGYRLFVRGIWGRHGDKTELETIFGDKKLVMKSGAPGTFFALFGTAVILISILKGFSVSPLPGDGHPIPADSPQFASHDYQPPAATSERTGAVEGPEGGSIKPELKQEQPVGSAPTSKSKSKPTVLRSIQGIRVQ